MQRTQSTTMPDLAAMQELVQRTWTPASRWHIGDLAWGSRTWRRGAADNGRLSVWREAGVVLAWGWAQPDACLDLAVDPARPELAREVLDWFHDVAARGTHTCTVSGGEDHLAAALLDAGYRPDKGAPYFSHHTMALDALPDPVPPAGFRLEQVGPADAARRAESHRRAWSDVAPSTLSTQSYARVMGAWPYRSDLDLVVRGPDGTWVANSLGWLDEQNRVGLLEPVGTAPEFRRLGLSRAVNLAVLHAIRDAGASTALVCPRGDDDYPVPGRLYRSLGFEPGVRTVSYVR